MAVTALKMIFQENFLILADKKLVFVIYKSVSERPRTSSFLLQQKLIWLAV